VASDTSFLVTTHLANDSYEEPCVGGCLTTKYAFQNCFNANDGGDM
jgi:hypothetical protein